MELLIVLVLAGVLAHQSRKWRHRQAEIDTTLGGLQREIAAMRARLARLERTDAASAAASASASATTATPAPAAAPPATSGTAPATPTAVARRAAAASPGSVTHDEATDDLRREAVQETQSALPLWLQRFMGANTLVRTGVLVLFFGVAFLLKWVSERVTFPIQGRLAATALGGLALAGLGWRLRHKRAGYALSLQGGGVGVAYITVYAAAKLYELLPLPVALALMLVIVALAALLAILQDALPLALLGAAGGFLAPILTSSDGGNYQLLLGYYVVLDLGILALAFAKTWRPLNLLGFVFTFVVQFLALAWAYTPAHYWGTAPFLWAFFALFVGITVLYARHRSLALLHYVDGTLVFGTPLATFALQGMLLRDVEHGLAYAAAAFGAIYLALTALVGRREIVPSMRLLGQAFLAIAVGFLTAAIPLYFDGRETSTLWALEGAAIAWIAVRQGRWLGQVFGVLLQVLAGLAFLSTEPWIYYDEAATTLPVLNATFFGYVVLAVSGFIVARVLVRSQSAELARVGSPALFAIGLAWAVAAMLHEVGRFVPPQDRLATLLTCFASLAAVLLYVRRRLDWPVAIVPVLGLLPVLLLALLAAAVSPSGHALVRGGVLAWPLAFGVMLLLFDALDREDGWIAHNAAWTHAGTSVLAVALLALEAAWSVDRVTVDAAELESAAVLGVAALALAALVWALRTARWPFRLQPRAHLLAAGGVMIACIVLATLLSNLLGDGGWPLGVHLPILNPVDATNVLGLIALWRWQREAWRAEVDLPYGRREAVLAWGALAFVVVNGILLRTLHHWAGTPYGAGMFRSTLLQAVLTVFWTLLAIGLMVHATRKGFRALWLAGGALLGVVVVKLFFFDLAALAGLERIVAFLGVGLMLLAIGYFSPVPPRQADDVPATSVG
ncbi:MAG TPA: DUF2339 domain-containing protein [Steroidobacteraceae bacterium]|nr:DUF2339 domain-containing protein [Steroidobacteraceae bacterium]